MPEYRIDAIGEDGQIATTRIFECADDQQAVQKAREMARDYSVVELRREGRVIAKFGG
jgi:hypothetical protein